MLRDTQTSLHQFYTFPVTLVQRSIYRYIVLYYYRLKRNTFLRCSLKKKTRKFPTLNLWRLGVWPVWSAEIFVASLNSLCAVNPESSHGLVNMLTICIARQTHVRNSQCSLKLLQRETTNTIMLTMSCLGIAVFNIYHAYSTAKILFQIIDLIA